MMRTEEDFIREGDDQLRDMDFKEELNKLNKHMDDEGGDYVVVNKPKRFNPDSEWEFKSIYDNNEKMM